LKKEAIKVKTKSAKLEAAVHNTYRNREDTHVHWLESCSL